MFKFLKEKLKSWVKKSEEKIEEKAEKIEEPIEETPEEAPTKEAEKPGKKEPGKKIKEKSEEKEESKKEPTKEIEESEINKKEPEKIDISDIRTAPTIKEIEKQKGKKSFFSRVKEKLQYKITQENFDEIFDDLEFLLLENNVALEVVESIRESLSQELIGRQIKKQELETEIKSALKKALNEIIIEPDSVIEAVKREKEPFKILFFGINGTGKTTTIAKLTNLFLKNNISCVLAAADTFRAASIEQLQHHADKLKVKLIKQDYNADPTAVAFDAIKYAQAHHIKAVLVDTAGRMHTKENLLNEMEKICRVTNPDLKIFIAESIAGNDAVEQAKAFNETIGIDGIILSKADVDEKGGTIISVSHITKKPIFYLGTGQNYSDLTPFDKNKFIDELGL